MYMRLYPIYSYKTFFRTYSKLTRNHFQRWILQNMSFCSLIPKSSTSSPLVEEKSRYHSKHSDVFSDSFKNVSRRVGLGLVLSILFMYLLTTFKEVCSVWSFLFTKILLLIDPETAHKLVVFGGKLNMLPVDYTKDDVASTVRIQFINNFSAANNCLKSERVVENNADTTNSNSDLVDQLMNEKGSLIFPNPIGLAAGFDKNAELPLELIKMGFGFVELGTITPLPQIGNPKPRIFRLKEDKAIINRCGFNNHGLKTISKRIQKVMTKRRYDPLSRHGIIGISLGKNKISNDTASDIATCVLETVKYADYLVINVSSPNTPGLRNHQESEALQKIILAVNSAIRKYIEQSLMVIKLSEAEKLLRPEIRNDSEKTKEIADVVAPMIFHNHSHRRPPVFIKVSPDLTMSQKTDIAKVVIENGIDGLIVTNTSTDRSYQLKSHFRDETGGLSGAPIRDISTQSISDFYKLTGGKAVIIASGGVFTGGQAMDKIEAGATLVELYSSLIYHGPGVIRRIKDDLAYLVYKKGYNNITDAIGIIHKGPRKQYPLRAPTFD